MLRRASNPTSPHGSRWWMPAGLVALLVVDAALVWFALSATRAPASAASPADLMPIGGPTARAEQAPTATPAPAAPPAPESVARVAVVLAAFDDRVAYRAATGACPSAPGFVEVTTDGGATWSAAALPEASAPSAIVAVSEAEAAVLASTDDDCDAVAYRTFVQGSDWAPGQSFDAAWRIEGAEVVAPVGARTAPCAGAPAQVTAADATNAAALCDDAAVVITSDGGAAWTPTSPVAGATAIAMRPGDAGSGIRVLLAGQGECAAGMQVAPLTADGAVGAAGACLPTDAAPGASTLAVDTGGGVWLWAGAQVARSADGGATW